jgi:hypothetical protein
MPPEFMGGDAIRRAPNANRWAANNQRRLEKKMKNVYPSKIQTAVDALLTKPASSAPALRQMVEAYAAGLGGSVRQAQELPTELVSYVNKVALYAYKVTDQDVQQLKDAGYSEDVIFEITLCASVGAGLARLERGRQALKGSQ